MTTDTDWLADARITGRVALVPLLYFAAEWVVSASWRGYYGYREDVVGPLGAAFCGPQGNWPCSDLYHVMNVALVATGAAVAIVAAGFWRQRVTDRGHALLLIVAGIGLACSGVVTVNVDYAWNLTATMVFLTLGAVGSVLVAVSSTSAMSVERRAIAVLAGALSLVGLFSFLGGHQVFGAGGAQRMATYGVLVAVIALGTTGLRTRHSAAAGAVLVEERR
ncbi:hypothetical protein GCM10009645_32690 [Mycolicibacterium poriferae]|uniref:DUF998 domain-containing protein n=1 Tax=Mycolicibacterium poriferae TaxID=39694 RepID=A0A6N4VBJ3_9MYCO|nr:DUF998 domain-containing protein [Mycolicibacterium poriferae]MCV7265644.1 DUF998 domain-containing protein [Mycolicibacterium poriferae]BBX51971.1 hypothetical protein MPOR_29970 [Mycolicibacterium poriferae]